MKRRLAVLLAIILCCGLSAAETAFLAEKSAAQGEAAGRAEESAALAETAAEREESAAQAETEEISLRVVPSGDLSFSNALYHYVFFDAEASGAETISIRLYDPRGQIARFRTKAQVDHNMDPVRKTTVNLKKGQTRAEGLSVYFPDGRDVGTWTIEVTASAKEKEDVSRRLTVEVTKPKVPSLGMLAQVHAMIDGAESTDPQPVTAGRIRYVCQNPKAKYFVSSYWKNKAYDLTGKADTMCTRAVFSMALSYLGIDSTPVWMSERTRSAEIPYTYDEVCEKLKNVIRVEGDLDTLWESYQAGEGSPIMLHFRHSEGMHALLLVARDPDDPEVFYGITSSQRVNTSAYPDGRAEDVIIPLVIEQGKEGQRLQSPFLKKYNRGIMDQIWQWRRTDHPQS